MSETSIYVVTDRAGRRVAGQFVSRGDLLTLTAQQAEFPLICGEIVPKGATAPDWSKSEIADRLRAEAAAFRARKGDEAPGATETVVETTAVAPAPPAETKARAARSDG